MSDRDIVAGLRRLWEAAPQGRWEVCGEPGWVDIWGNDGDLYHLDYIEGDDTNLSPLIVAMHNYLPQLLDVVECAQGYREFSKPPLERMFYEERLDAALTKLGLSRATP